MNATAVLDPVQAPAPGAIHLADDIGVNRGPFEVPAQLGLFEDLKPMGSLRPLPEGGGLGGYQGAEAASGQLRLNFDAPESGPPPRPRWQAAQADPGADLAGFGFEPEPSYRGGKRVPYGTRGSVRPDYVSERVRLSVDVKDYDVATPQGRWRLVKDVVGQTGERAANLPEGIRQGVLIDIRGQQISDKLLQRMLDRIVTKSNGVIQPENIEVRR